METDWRRHCDLDDDDDDDDDFSEGKITLVCVGAQLIFPLLMMDGCRWERQGYFSVVLYFLSLSLSLCSTHSLLYPPHPSLYAIVNDEETLVLSAYCLESISCEAE